MKSNPSLFPYQLLYLAGALLAISLLAAGYFLTPGIKPWSGIPALVLLVVYAGLGWWGAGWVGYAEPAILRIALIAGLLAGAVFTGEILLEYIFLPADNSTYGLIEFGSVFTIYFLAGLVAAFHSRRLRNGFLGAIATAFLSTLIWVIAVLLVYYLFRGTARQALVFSSEGNYTDFARSGMSDFNVFVMEDFMGAVFFHALLSPLAAAVLGAGGGLVGKLLAGKQEV